MKLYAYVFILLFSVTSISFALEELGDLPVELKISNTKVEINKCSKLELFFKQSGKENKTSTFLIKTTSGLNLFSDSECKVEKTGINQIKSDERLTYYYKINLAANTTLSIIGVGKEKWKISKSIVSQNVEQITKAILPKPAPIIPQFIDNEVIDLKNLTGEIKNNAYYNLKIQLQMTSKYYTGKCEGPIHILIPNFYSIIRGTQFATFNIVGNENTKFYSDLECKTPITNIIFPSNKPMHTIFLKSDISGSAFINLKNKNRDFAQNNFSFEAPPKKIDKKIALENFKKKLNREYFYSHMIRKDTTPEAVEFYKRKYDGYEKAQKNKDPLLENYLEDLYNIFHRD